MKSAYFKYTEERNGKIYILARGEIIQDNAGKISIRGISSSLSMRAATKYRAKMLAMEIVKADFNHPNVTYLEVVETSGLIALLTKETAELRRIFIQKTKEYAVKRFGGAVKRSEWTEEKWRSEFGQTELKYPMKVYVDNKLTTITHDLIKFAKVMRSEDRCLINLGVAKYIQSKIKQAEQHYTRSIEKLAYRLKKKGLTDDVANISVKTATIGVNINTYIAWPGGMIHAWTIIASGPVQAPHYRYLIK